MLIKKKYNIYVCINKVWVLRLEKEQLWIIGLASWTRNNKHSLKRRKSFWINISHPLCCPLFRFFTGSADPGDKELVWSECGLKKTFYVHILAYTISSSILYPIYSFFFQRSSAKIIIIIILIHKKLPVWCEYF